jgi:hypothetical protein
MQKPVIYIAGPYSGDTRLDVSENLWEAVRAVYEIYEVGAMGLFTPLMTDVFAGEFLEETMLERDLWLLERCDAVYVIPGWQESEGAQVEVNHAKSLNLPVFDSLAALEIFIKSKSKSQQRRLAIQGGIEE